MVNRCLTAALQLGASDIHLQPRAERWEVSFRVDGVLHEAESFDRNADSDPVSRLMALAGLPSYCSGVPQEGPLRWRSQDGTVREMRLGIFPTVHGLRAAIRILEPVNEIRSIDQLGFDDVSATRLRAMCDSRDGCLLVAGPAGSGKTTTLYACLSHIATAESNRSVLAIEDPVEAVIDSISQSQLQPASGMTLASALRAAVRQDAEVLLVSEIRDEETAEAVLAASMTGHLCFSSIHAGSIGSTLRRLVQMKLPTFAIQSGLRGLLCQRLLRQTCAACHDEHDATPDRDCDRCHGTGYRGRIPILQLLDFENSSVGAEVFGMLENGCAARQLDELVAEAGIESLHDQAQQLVESRRTDASEVFRVLGRRPA